MATENADLQIRINARESVTPTLKNAQSSIIRFVGAVSSLVATLGAVTFPIAQAKEFDRAMRDVQKTTDFSNTAIESLGASLIQLSKQLPNTASGLAAIAAAAGQLGLGREGPEAIRSFTESVARASVTLDLIEDKAASSAAKIVNVFNIPLNNTENIFSTINELSNTTSATADELIDIIKRVGTVGGLTFTEVAALAAQAIEVGLSPEVAGTSLVKLFSNFESKAEKFAEALGITVGEWMGRGATDRFQDFLSLLSTEEAAPRAELIRELAGGGRVFAFVDKLAKDAANGFKIFNATLKSSSDAFATGTSSIEEYANVAQSLQVQTDLLVNNIKALAIEVGNQLVPTLIDVTRKLQNFFQQNDTREIILGIGDALGGAVDNVVYFVNWMNQLGFSFASVIRTAQVFLALFAGKLLLTLGNRLVFLGAEVVRFAGTWHAVGDAITANTVKMEAQTVVQGKNVTVSNLQAAAMGRVGVANIAASGAVRGWTVVTNAATAAQLWFTRAVDATSLALSRGFLPALWSGIRGLGLWASGAAAAATASFSLIGALKAIGKGFVSLFLLLAKSPIGLVVTALFFFFDDILEWLGIINDEDAKRNRDETARHRERVERLKEEAAQYESLLGKIEAIRTAQQKRTGTTRQDRIREGKTTTADEAETVLKEFFTSSEALELIAKRRESLKKEALIVQGLTREEYVRLEQEREKLKVFNEGLTKLRRLEEIAASPTSGVGGEVNDINIFLDNLEKRYEDFDRDRVESSVQAQERITSATEQAYNHLLRQQEDYTRRGQEADRKLEQSAKIRKQALLELAPLLGEAAGQAIDAGIKVAELKSEMEALAIASKQAVNFQPIDEEDAENAKVRIESFINGIEEAQSKLKELGTGAALNLIAELETVRTTLEANSENYKVYNAQLNLLMSGLTSGTEEAKQKIIEYKDEIIKLAAATNTAVNLNQIFAIVAGQQVDTARQGAEIVDKQKQAEEAITEERRRQARAIIPQYVLYKKLNEELDRTKEILEENKDAAEGITENLRKSITTFANKTAESIKKLEDTLTDRKFDIRVNFKLKQIDKELQEAVNKIETEFDPEIEKTREKVEETGSPYQKRKLARLEQEKERKVLAAQSNAADAKARQEAQAEYLKFGKERLRLQEALRAAQDASAKGNTTEYQKALNIIDETRNRLDDSLQKLAEIRTVDNAGNEKAAIPDSELRALGSSLATEFKAIEVQLRPLGEQLEKVATEKLNNFNTAVTNVRTEFSKLKKEFDDLKAQWPELGKVVEDAAKNFDVFDTSLRRLIETIGTADLQNLKVLQNLIKGGIPDELQRSIKAIDTPVLQENITNATKSVNTGEEFKLQSRQPNQKVFRTTGEDGEPLLTNDVQVDSKGNTYVDGEQLQAVTNTADIYPKSVIVKGGKLYNPDESTPFASGGMVTGPGTSRSDSILARLSNGEYVMDAASTKFFGSSFFSTLQSLAKKGSIPKFANGGVVGAGGALGSALQSAGNNVYLTIPGAGQFGPMSADDAVVKSMSQALAKQALKKGVRR